MKIILVFLRAFQYYNEFTSYKEHFIHCDISNKILYSVVIVLILSHPLIV